MWHLPGTFTHTAASHIRLTHTLHTTHVAHQSITHLHPPPPTTSHLNSHLTPAYQHTDTQNLALRRTSHPDASMATLKNYRCNQRRSKLVGSQLGQAPAWPRRRCSLQGCCLAAAGSGHRRLWHQAGGTKDSIVGGNMPGAVFGYQLLEPGPAALRFQRLHSWGRWHDPGAVSGLAMGSQHSEAFMKRESRTPGRPGDAVSGLAVGSQHS